MVGTVQRAASVEVVNLGVPGFGTDEYLLCQAYGHTLQADMLVMYVERCRRQRIAQWEARSARPDAPVFHVDERARYRTSVEYADQTRPYLYQDFPDNASAG